VTETSTRNTTSVTERTTTVTVTPHNTGTQEAGSGGLEWWGWALIALGAIVVGLIMYMVGRGHREPPAGGPGAPPPGGPPYGAPPMSSQGPPNVPPPSRDF
jgi:hypothetical protein